MENTNNNQVVKKEEVTTAATIKRDMMNIVFKQAQFFASSTIVPAIYQNNPSNCFIAVQMAERMGADPFQVMQSLNIIQGRPAWSSQFIIASINQSGRFKTQLNYKITGKWPNADFSCIAYATSNDGTLCESIPITYAMAKAEGWIDKKGSKWQTMPDLMARYRAASFFGKQYCPDLLLGIMSAEESRDIIDAEAYDIPTVQPSAETKHTTPQDVAHEQEQENATVDVDLETGEVTEPVQETTPQDEPMEDDWAAKYEG